MKNTIRVLAIVSALMCLLCLLPAMSASAEIATDTALTAAMMASNPNVKMTANSDDSFDVSISNDSMMETMLDWPVQINVKKTPYWIVQVKSMWTGNNPMIRANANGVFVGMLTTEGYLVVDLRKYTTGDVFNGNLSMLYQDYYSSRMKQGRSVTKLAMWASSTADLKGKVTDKNRIPAVDFLTPVSSAKTFKVSEGVKSANLLLDPVDENGFDMAVDPDQELETYSNLAGITFFAYVDLDKVPFIHVELSELEISFVGTVSVHDNTNGATMRGRNMDYVTAGNSGVVTYDLRTMVGKGKQYLSFAIMIDDGFNASGPVNYVARVWLDNQEKASASAKKTTTTTTAKTTAAKTTAGTTAGGTTGGDVSEPADEPASDVDSDVPSDVNSEDSEVSDLPSSDVPAAADDEKDGNSLLLPILLAVLGGLVVGGGAVAAVLIVLKKKNKF